MPSLTWVHMVGTLRNDLVELIFGMACGADLVMSHAKYELQHQCLMFKSISQLSDATSEHVSLDTSSNFIPLFF